MHAMRLTLCAAALAVLPALAAPPRFAWPETANVKVTYSARRVRTQASQTRSSQRQNRYELKVTRRGERLELERVRSVAERKPSAFDTGWQKVDAEGKPVPNYDEVQGLLDEGAELVPVLHVSMGGEFQGVAGAAPLREELGRILNRSGLPEPVRERVRGLFSDAALAGLAKEQWSLWAGVWRELDLAPGRPVVQQRRGMFPGTAYEIDLRLEFKHGGRVPCRAGASGRECVALEAVSRADSAQVARTLARLKLAGVAIKDVQLEQNLTLVTRPDTLQPQSCTRSLSARLEPLPGSKQEALNETLEEAWTFEW